jgi:hypothetical protein
MGRIKGLILKGCFIPLLFIVSERSFPLDQGLVYTFNFIESNGCSEFYLSVFDQTEMVVAGSHSEVCLKKYVERYQNSISKDDWQILLKYISSKRSFELLVQLYELRAEQYDSDKSFARYLCYLHDEGVEEHQSLKGFCSGIGANG